MVQERSRSVSVQTRGVEQPTDAVVRVVMACVCGSDLWYYRGVSEHAIGWIGHEFTASSKPPPVR